MTDSSYGRGFAGYLVPIKPPKAAELVTDEKVCISAAKAYHGAAGPPRDLAEQRSTGSGYPRRNFYIVEWEGTLTDHGGYWETVLFDKNWKNLSNWGGGA